MRPHPILFFPNAYLNIRPIAGRRNPDGGYVAYVIGSGSQRRHTGLCADRAMRGPDQLCHDKFEDTLSHSSREGGNSPKMSPGQSQPDQEEAVVYEGLCVNCALRETCEPPNQNGGVWHCEDYC